eukprot:354780_1
MLFLELLKTFVHFALVKWAWAKVESLSTSKDHLSIVLFLTSCAKAATSPVVTELAENLSTETSSLMKISVSSILALVFFLWRTLAQTPTAPNFSYALYQLHGLMVSMLCLEM